MGQTSDPETLVIHQNMKPGNNPEDFKQHYDNGGSLQLHNFILLDKKFEVAPRLLENVYTLL
jgi:hypothetical protein